MLCSSAVEERIICPVADDRTETIIASFVGGVVGEDLQRITQLSTSAVPPNLMCFTWCAWAAFSKFVAGRAIFPQLLSNSSIRRAADLFLLRRFCLYETRGDSRRKIGNRVIDVVVHCNVVGSTPSSNSS